MADDLNWRANNAQLTTTGIVHNPQSEWAKEARKWEATHTEFGPPGRPYVYREYPTWMFKAAALPEGGIGIVAHELVETPEKRDRFESAGFRMEPLQAIEAYTKQQLEFAKLAAEREYDKRHGLSAKAVAEVNAIEDAAGAQHLPTIAERPGRRRGRPRSTMTDGERAKRSVEG